MVLLANMEVKGAFCHQDSCTHPFKSDFLSLSFSILSLTLYVYVCVHMYME